MHERRKPLWRAALALLLAAGVAGCGGGAAAPTAFDLTAPRGRQPGTLLGQLVVAEPIGIQVYNSERIVVRQGSSLTYLAGAQWTDTLPRLLQSRIIQAFENSSRIKAVGRPGERLTADRQLNLEIRAFEVDTARAEAVVEITGKLVNDQTGKIALARTFVARAPVAAVDGATATAALDAALQRVLVEIVLWAR